MDIRLIPNLVDVSLCLVALFVAIRSFDIYTQFHYQRLAILSLSMVQVSLAAAASFTTSYVHSIPLHTEWFVSIGQSIGFLFIFLSLVIQSHRSLQTLVMMNVGCFVCLLVVLLFTPILPAVPNSTVELVLQFPRFLLCALIFFTYFWSFTGKPTSFNLLMNSAFFLLSFSYLIILMQNVTGSAQGPLGTLGGVVGVLGLVPLVIGVSLN